MAPPFPQILHLDNRRARRQGIDAVLLPIVYDLPEQILCHPETIFIQIAAPDLPADSTPTLAEFLGREEKKRNLASLKRKADTRNFRIPKAAQQNQPEVDPTFASPGPPKSKRLFKSVLILLLSVVGLVFFVWLTFR